MDANRYQKQAARTLIDHPDFGLRGGELMVIWNAVGLAGETGEVVDLIKKAIFHKHGLDMDALEKELGDVCWYLAALCTKLDLNLADVMKENIDKLRQRYPDGFDFEASRNRHGDEEKRKRTRDAQGDTLYRILRDAIDAAREYEEQHGYSRDAAAYEAASEIDSLMHDVGHSATIDAAIDAGYRAAAEQ